VIKVDVVGLSVDQRTEAPVVLLRVPPGKLCLPIWIGPAEAASIALALRGEQFARPLTHDLLATAIDGLGGGVQRVTITDQRDGTYFARLFLERDREVLAIDARPSDCIALALRTEAPIYLEDSLLAKVQDSLLPLESLERPGPPPAPPDQEDA
jgi:uncharacterized protein